MISLLFSNYVLVYQKKERVSRKVLGKYRALPLLHDSFISLTLNLTKEIFDYFDLEKYSFF